MKHKKAYFLRYLHFMTLSTVLFFVGTVFAVSTKINDRTEYSTSLNSVASVIMNWYGSLITNSDVKGGDIVFNMSNINEQSRKYRSNYPRNISQIIITSTNLMKLSESDDYQFKVKSKVTYKKNKKEHTKILNETFVINGSLLTHQNIVPIKSIGLDKAEESERFESSKYNRYHYKVREFTYAWLAYIDGIDTLKSTMNANAWLDKAMYSLKIGAEQTQGSITSVLEKKRQLLTKGGHLLRSLDVTKEATNPNIIVIDLILEWKGTNLTGKPVVAKIHQEIKVKIKADKSWEVISINEEHLLPIIAPWMGLVC